jgi:hypothetical protein
MHVMYPISSRFFRSCGDSSGSGDETSGSVLSGNFRLPKGDDNRRIGLASLNERARSA